MSGKIAFFDFDGTITTKDTMLEFLRFYSGSKVYYRNMAKLLPSLLRMKAGFITNHVAKEAMLTLFLGGKTEEEVIAAGKEFAAQKLPSLIRPGAMKKIAELRSRGAEIVIVTASSDYWVAPWCVANKTELIATKLETKNGIITGRLHGNNCHGQEKVRRIEERYRLQSFEEISCFGDTRGDLPMLSIAHHRYYKPFRD